MAQNITIAGASYQDVPAVNLPKTGGGEATFLDAENYRTAAQQDVIDGGKQNTLISSGATVGQFARITSVDGSGKPTGWAPVSDNAVHYTADAGKTDAEKAIARANIGAAPIPKGYELIEKIIFGYSITTTEPDDWADNYASYFTNTGTAKEPVYTAVTGETAPTWESGKYYSYDATGSNSATRNKEPDGTNYNFDSVLVYYRLSSSSAVGVQVEIVLEGPWTSFFYVGEIHNGSEFLIEARRETNFFRGLSSSRQAGTYNSVITQYYRGQPIDTTKKIRQVACSGNRWNNIPGGSEVYIYAVRM